METDLSEVLLDLDLTEVLLELFLSPTGASILIAAWDSVPACPDGNTTYKMNSRSQ